MQTRYAQEVAKFNKKDGILAICVFFAYVLFSNVFALLVGMSPMTGFVRNWIIPVGLMIFAFGVFIVVKARKQKLSSIGLYKENLGKGIGLSLPFCLIPIIFIAIIPGILHGFFEINLTWLALTLISTFLFAAHEDIIFVGFIQTRLHGFIKSYFLAIFVAIFKKYYSIVPIFILHTINNFSNVFSYSNMTFANVSIVVCVLAACFLYWQTHKTDKKALVR